MCDVVITLTLFFLSFSGKTLQYLIHTEAGNSDELKPRDNCPGPIINMWKCWKIYTILSIFAKKKKEENAVWWVKLRVDLCHAMLAFLKKKDCLTRAHHRNLNAWVLGDFLVDFINWALNFKVKLICCCHYYWGPIFVEHEILSFGIQKAKVRPLLG